MLKKCAHEVKKWGAFVAGAGFLLVLGGVVSLASWLVLIWCGVKLLQWMGVIG